MSTTETFIVDRDGLTVSALLWRRYKRPVPGLLDVAIALNPGLAGQGPFVPRGTKVVLPIASAASARRLPLVKLWD